MLCFLYCNHIIQIHSFYFNILECVGPLTPKVFQSTERPNGNYPASSVLILGEQDALLTLKPNVRYNYWAAEAGKTTGQGFTVRVDYCPRMIAGVQIKNARNQYKFATYEFKVSASLNKTGPWETMVDSFLREAAPLRNFTFNQQVKLKYLKFELISYHGTRGGGLQYFAAIPATSKASIITNINLK